jgi:hypothetical protein
MAEQNRYPFDWNARQEQLDRERIAEAVGMSVCNFGKFKQSLQARSPVRNCHLKFAHT